MDNLGDGRAADGAGVARLYKRRTISAKGKETGIVTHADAGSLN